MTLHVFFLPHPYLVATLTVGTATVAWVPTLAQRLWHGSQHWPTGPNFSHPSKGETRNYNVTRPSCILFLAVCQRPCQNGGRCFKKDKCSCPYGYWGDVCQYGKKNLYNFLLSQDYINAFSYINIFSSINNDNCYLICSSLSSSMSK